MKNTRLVLTVKRNKDQIKFTLPNNQEIKIIMLQHKSGNNNYIRTVIECPEDIKIKREFNDEHGNHL